MNPKAQRRIAAAERAAFKLDQFGERNAANDVRALCRTYRSSLTLNSVLHKENSELRRASTMETLS